MQFLITCETCDTASITTCLEGLKAHADVEFFPVILASDTLKLALVAEITHLDKKLDETWYAEFPNYSSLETFCQLMESIPFNQEEFIRIAFHDPRSGVLKVWPLEQFHKAVIVDGLFRNA